MAFLGGLLDGIKSTYPPGQDADETQLTCRYQIEEKTSALLGHSSMTGFSGRTAHVCKPARRHLGKDPDDPRFVASLRPQGWTCYSFSAA